MSHPSLPHKTAQSTHRLPASLAGLTADDFRALGSSVSWRDEPSEAERIIGEAEDWERRERAYNRESYRREG